MLSALDFPCLPHAYEYHCLFAQLTTNNAFMLFIIFTIRALLAIHLVPLNFRIHFFKKIFYLSSLAFQTIFARYTQSLLMPLVTLNLVNDIRFHIFKRISPSTNVTFPGNLNFVNFII